MPTEKNINELKRKIDKLEPLIDKLDELKESFIEFKDKINKNIDSTNDKLDELNELNTSIEQLNQEIQLLNDLITTLNDNVGQLEIKTDELNSIFSDMSSKIDELNSLLTGTLNEENIQDLINVINDVIKAVRQLETLNKPKKQSEEEQVDQAQEPVAQGQSAQQQTGEQVLQKQAQLSQTGKVIYIQPPGEGGNKFEKNLKIILKKGGSIDVENLKSFINSNEGIIQVSNSIPELDELNNLSPLLILQSNNTELDFFNENLNNFYERLFGISNDNIYLENPTKDENNIKQLLYLIKFDYVGLDSVIEQQSSENITETSAAMDKINFEINKTIKSINIEDKNILNINNKKYKVNRTYYDNLKTDIIKKHLKDSYSKAGAGYYNYNQHFNNSFNHQQLYGGQYAGQYYYPPRQIKQPLHNFIVPLMVFKMYRIILYKKLLKSEQKFVFQNIFIDIVSSFMLIIGLFTLGLKKVASVLFTDLLSSVVVIYLFLFAYDDYVKDKSKVNVQYIINVLILIPYFVMYL